MLYLDDELTTERLTVALLPDSGERTVASAVVAVEVADDGLTENLSADGETQ